MAHCQGLTVGGLWNKEEAQLHINALEMNAAKLAIESFCRVKKPKSVHLQINNMTALSHLVKMGRRNSAELRTQQNFEGNLGVLNCELDHTYCRIPPKFSKHSPELGVMPYQGLE